MVKANKDIRDLIKSSPVYSYQVAKEYGVSDNYFTVLLRHELTDEKKNKIRAIVKQLSEEAQGC